MPDGRRLCSAWFGADAVTIRALGGAGFSGSHVFLVRHASGERFVLKSFAGGTPLDRAAWVHALMRHLRLGGVEEVPRVVAVRNPTDAEAGGGTLAADPAGTLWELVEFVAGGARAVPGDAEAAAALAGLARLHAAAATLPGAAPAAEPSAGVERRIEQARRMLASPWQALEPAATGPDLGFVRPALLQGIEAIESDVGRRALARLAATKPAPLPVQAVLRDVWSEHVLFAADGRLAGFIDFHAAGRDTPATDLARLLGSWEPPTAPGATAFAARWRHALDAYESVRPLSAVERRMIPWLHATGVVCGLDNWFRWLVADRRRFAGPDRVLYRIARLLRQLPEALAAVHEPLPGRD